MEAFLATYKIYAILFAALLAAIMLLSGCNRNPEEQLPLWKGEDGPVIIENNDAVARSLPFTDVLIQDAFWSARQEQFVCVTVMAGIENVERSGGGISNIVNTALMHRGQAYEPHAGALYVDSDVHKLVEAMCYALQMRGNEQVQQAQEEIRAKLEEWIPYYQDAQEKDGYFDTYFTLAHPDEKWTDFNLHELYCMGHFYEAAVAHYRLTDGVDTRLFDMAVKNADYVESLFGPGKWKQVPGHQEIELALLKLANLCREIGTLNGVDYTAKAEKYVALANFFLSTRGDHEGRHGESFWPEGCQDVLPVNQQTEALSHAVRAHYMYTGMADAMLQSGEDKYKQALLALWDSVNTKTYVTGGTGVSNHHEGYGPDYYMPLDKAYCETCASVSNIMWNQRMNLLFGEAKYADKMETVLYNSMLSGINLDGNRFFYTNVVSTPGRERVRWYGTACCPPNLMRTVLSLGGYLYAQKGDEVCLNLYIGNEAKLLLSQGELKLTIESGFPWQGKVKITASCNGDRDMALRLRIPQWASGENTMTLNGETYGIKADAEGYLTINRTWMDGDTVELTFPMEVQKIPMIEGVEDTKDYTAFRRGPMVYAAEQVDNAASPQMYYLPGNASFIEAWVENLDGKEDPFGLRGVMKITTEDAMIHYPGGDEKASLTMVPYFCVGNRGLTRMETYISTVAREYPLERHAKPSASFTFSGNDTDSPLNLNDGNEAPASRWTSFTGPLQPWVEYEFDYPVTVSGSRIMWYDDGGGVQVPSGLKIEYWDGVQYVSVNPRGEYQFFPENAYGTYWFDSVTTTRLRMTIDNTATQIAVGIVEWKLIG